MEKIDNIELLSQRLSELHGLLSAFLSTLEELAQNGLLAKSLARRELKYDSADGDLRGLIIALNYLGEKLAWLDQTHLEDEKPRQNMNRSDLLGYDGLMAKFSYAPKGNRLCDTLMELTDTLIQMDCMLLKLEEDWVKGRFHNELDYPSEDITRVLAGLAMDHMLLFDSFCRVMLAVSLESEPDTGDSDFRAMRKRDDIQERDVKWLTEFVKTRPGSKKK